MSGTVIMYDNLVDDYTITADDEVITFEASNLQDSRVSTYWKADTIGSAVRVVLDAGVGNTISPDSAAIIGHNLSDSGTYKIMGNATDSWGSPSLEETFTYNSKIMHDLFTGSAYRYWAFEFDDSGNSDGYIRVGRLFLGDYSELSRAFNQNFSYTPVDTSNKSTTPTGEQFTDRLAKIEKYSLTFGSLNNTQKLALETIFDDIRLEPFVILFNKDDTTGYPAKYVSVDSYPSFQHIFNLKWSCNMTLTEAK